MKRRTSDKVNSSHAKDKRSKEELEKERLIVIEIMDLKPIKLPGDVNRDVKKLTKFLTDLTDNYNKLIKGCQRLN